MKAGIYTRTGDDGTSSIRDGRRGKDDLVFEVLGTFDELNSWLGMCPPSPMIEKCQGELFKLMGTIAGYGEFKDDISLTIEDEIDRMNPGKEFRFANPHGPVHVARAVCRRAERLLVRFDREHPALPFVNRLSDYLFTLAEFGLRRESV